MPMNGGNERKSGGWSWEKECGVGTKKNGTSHHMKTLRFRIKNKHKNLFGTIANEYRTRSKRVMNAIDLETT